jgi:predicted glutamine amidotransferase
VVEDLPRLEQELGDAMALVQGETDSERFFALITREIDAHDGDVRGGIVAAVRWAAEHLRVYSINLVLLAGDELYALRYPDTNTLHVLVREAGGDHGSEPLHQRSSLGTRVSSEHAAQQPVVVVASEHLDDDPGWREFASGELLRVSPTLEVSSENVLPDPPRHPLTLQDLAAPAQASQAPKG